MHEKIASFPSNSSETWSESDEVLSRLCHRMQEINSSLLCTWLRNPCLVYSWHLWHFKTVEALSRGVLWNTSKTGLP